LVTVGVFVGVAVGVLVEVAVGVNVGVGVEVGVLVGVTVGVGVGMKKATTSTVLCSSSLRIWKRLAPANTMISVTKLHFK
jgi:hypothetical protein